MKSAVCVAAALCAASLCVSSAFATPIDYFTDNVGTSNTQIGRQSRQAVFQTWAHAENYPGLTATASTFYYKTYTYTATQLLGGTYIDVSVFDEQNIGNIFVSAYSSSYNPLSPSTNWLGNEGYSGNLLFNAGTLGDARDFQVILPTGSSLILVVNTSAANSTAGTTDLYDIGIASFIDDQGTDATGVAVTPEPSTFVEFGTGLLAMAGVARRRLFAA